MPDVFDFSSLVLFYILHVYILFPLKNLPFVVYLFWVFFWHIVVLLVYTMLFFYLVILLYSVYMSL